MEILNNIFLDFRDYFVSVYENTLFQLALFTCALWLVFFISHVLKNLRIRKSRRSIPLVIGGWGTRGKSGTERLKAGLFNALGFGVVSKTSGCEAMFLHSHPYSQLREMFLFRPYDKATIWEQADVLNIAGKLETDVMLWECMGLTPTYIEVLQRSWTQDDLSTITNTYPDHEDVQGPAGINVTEVMGSFIPRNSRLITTEEVMFPRLEDFSRDLNSSVEQVNWLDVGLLTSDLMERFPYSAHPNNVALVLAIADEFQIPRDYAVKEMSDRVVPDLGVLKTFPAADLRGRKLIFTLGNSANEKFGCLGNWTRLGFDKISVEKDPDVFVTTVVNNRADRIPRSRVFAGIITGDISADRHFLVGNNLKGFMSMIEDELEHNLSQVSLWGRDNKGSKEEAVEELVKKADWLRLPVTDNTITSRLGAMLKVSLTDRNQLDLICSLWDSPEKLEEKLKELKSDNVDDICYWVKHYLEARKGFVRSKKGFLTARKQNTGR